MRIVAVLSQAITQFRLLPFADCFCHLAELGNDLLERQRGESDSAMYERAAKAMKGTQDEAAATVANAMKDLNQGVRKCAHGHGLIMTNISRGAAASTRLTVLDATS